MTKPAARASLAHAALFLAGFAAVALLVPRLTGEQEIGDLTAKLRHFEANKDRYDLLFVGSSRIRRGLAPARFDAELAECGIELRSFNLGVAGMEPHLANAVVRRVLALKPAHLRFMVIELGDWEPRIHPRNRFKRRAIFWHDATETSWALRSTLHAELPVRAKADLAATHLLHFAARLTGAGRGADAVRRALRGRPARPRAPVGDGFAAYPSVPLDEPSHHPMRRRFQREQKGYRQAVESLSKPAAAGTPVLGDYYLAALEAQAARLREAGVEPVYVITAIPRAASDLTALGASGAIPNLLAFNRPGIYPELYAVEHRFDHEHLSLPGALAFTGHLASRFSTTILEHACEGALPDPRHAPELAAEAG